MRIGLPSGVPYRLASMYNQSGSQPVTEVKPSGKEEQAEYHGPGKPLRGWKNRQ